MNNNSHNNQQAGKDKMLTDKEVKFEILFSLVFSAFVFFSGYDQGQQQYAQQPAGAGGHGQQTGFSQY